MRKISSTKEIQIISIHKKEFWLHLTYLWFILEIGPASVMVGNLVSGKRIAQASGRDLGQIEDNDQARKVSRTFLIYLLFS